MRKLGMITANKSCDNKECPDYGQTNNDNIIGFGHSSNGVQRYRCKTCEATFTETKGTIFYGRHTSRKDIFEALAMLAERMSIAAVARVKGIKEDTVSSWLKEAASNVAEIEEVLLKDYHVDKAQMDSLWTYVGNKGYEAALIKVYGVVPKYSGRGRPPTKKQARSGWEYLQIVKHRRGGHLVRVTTKVVFGDPETVYQKLGKHNSYVERTHLTSRHMNGRFWTIEELLTTRVSPLLPQQHYKG